MGSDRDLEKYYCEYTADYGFERIMVKYRRHLVLDRVRAGEARTVLEVGCGSELLYKHYLKDSAPLDAWVIVEPVREFVEQARLADLPNAIVINGPVETSTDRIRDAFCNEPPDLIIAASLLHELSDVHAFLASVITLMERRTVLHVNVPNAGSLHRRLAQAMGLIGKPTEFSDRNRSLLQHRVYDLQTLICDIERSGLRVIETGGGLIKPFTHKQMEEISSVIGEDILDGLYVLGRHHPDWASEIFAEACLA
jgi:Methyltransferase domain